MGWDSVGGEISGGGGHAHAVDLLVVYRTALFWPCVCTMVRLSALWSYYNLFAFQGEE